MIALQNGISTTASPKGDSALPVTDYTLQNVLLCAGDNDIKKDLSKIEAAAGLEHTLSATISPNSSKVPLLVKEGSEEDGRARKATEEPNDVSALFSFLQVLTATFGSFAHGGNDVR